MSKFVQKQIPPISSPLWVHKLRTRIFENVGYDQGDK